MFKKKSVLYRYMASFVSITMICCVVIGMVSYFVAAKELRQSAINERNKRLALAAEDISEQFELLEEISHHVMITAYYSPSYFSRNPYYEVELLSEFKKYKNYSSLFSHYFLHYNDKDFVFADTGKASTELYLDIYVSPEDTPTIMPLLKNREVGFYSFARGSLAIYPLSFTVTRNYNGAATISFFLPAENLLNRAQLMSGETFTRMEIYYNDTPVFSTGNVQSPVAVQYAGVTLVLDNEEIGVNTNDYFLRLSLRLLFIFAAMLCVLAIYVAVYNFRPIANLARRHNVEDGANELEHLDKTINAIKNELQLSQEELLSHMTKFRMLRDDLQRYFVTQIVQGAADEKSMERMREAGMHFPGETFYVFILCPATSNGSIALEKTISELNNDHAAFYICPYEKENNFAVIVNTDSGKDVSDILHEACPDAYVYGGSNTDLLKEIPTLLFYALTEANPASVQLSDITRYNEDEYLQRFRKALEDGDEMLALERLDEYYAAYANYNDTIKKMIRSNIISTLLGISYEMKMSVPQDFLTDPSESFSMLSGWITAICSRRENASDSFASQVIDYIKNHILDFDLSLQSIADNFGRSTRQISRIVRTETSQGYKEFVIQLRMEYAKVLLCNGKRVIDVCEEVCYTSQSHFINVFTQYTGMTPANYREQEEKNRAKKTGTT